MLTDSTFNQKVQQEIVDGWRVAIITLPDYPEKLFAFAEMAADISSRWDNKADAVDTLLNVALVTGLTDAFGRREIEHTIGRAWSENNKPNGQGDNKGRTRLDEPPPFTYVDIARELVPREWIVPDRVPARNITLLSGEGAVGKSILLLQLSAAIVLGRDWIGTLPKQGVVLYLSCEDDDDEINRRLEDIAKHYGVTRADLKASLHVISLAGKDAILGAADRSSQIKPTALFAQLRAEAQRLHPTLIVIDTVADVFGGDEINRAQTRHFLTLLRGLITEIDSAMVLASHPSLEGIRSGSGISGTRCARGCTSVLPTKLMTPNCVCLKSRKRTTPKSANKFCCAGRTACMCPNRVPVRSTRWRPTKRSMTCLSICCGASPKMAATSATAAARPMRRRFLKMSRKPKPPRQPARRSPRR